MCCTGARVTGSRTTTSRPRRSGTRSPDISSHRAAELVELTVPTMLRDRQEALLRGWIELLPEELLQVRPVLSNGYVAALLSTGTIEGVDRHLQYAERWLDGSDARCRNRGAHDPDGRRGRRGVPPAAGRHRRPPCRAGAGAGRSSRHGGARPAGAGPLRRGRRCRTWSGRRPDRDRGLDRRRSRGSPRGVRRVHGANAASGTPVRRTRRARSRWRTSGSPRAGSRDAMRTYEQALQVAPEPSRTGRCCAGRLTCTSG